MPSHDFNPRRIKRPAIALLRAPAKDEASNVVRRDGHAPAYGVIERPGILLVRLPSDDVPGGIHEVDLTEWLTYGSLGGAIADYFASWGPTTKSGTREGFVKKLRPFRSFLIEREAKDHAPVRALPDLTKALVNAYESWLNHRGVEEGGAPLSDLTKGARYNALKDVVEHALASTRFAGQVAADLSFKRNPWPGKHHKIQSRKAVSHLDLALVRRACIEDIKATLDRLRLGQAARLMSSEDLPPPGSKSVIPYHDIRVRVAVLHARYGGAIPGRDDLKGTDPGLARSMVPPYGSIIDTGAHLHFTARALVPFVLLIGIDGSFNPEGLLTLEWGDVERHHPIFGQDRWRITARKDRAGTPHRRSFAAGLSALESPVNLLRAVEEHSRHTRDHLPNRLRNRVFVFWQSRGERFSAFDNPGGASGDSAWRNNLAGFIRDHGLPSFSLAELRVTGSDIVDVIAGGDIKAKQEALGHANATTTQRHYETTVAKQRGREALSVAMAWRERFIASNGLSDSRDGRLSEGAQTAATPGFGCFEPLYSPMPGQRDGRACSAFGSCAACPLAWVDVRAPKALIRLRQFRSRIEEARTEVHPDRWLARWLPQLKALDEFWLPRFPAETVQASASVTLPPLPLLE